MAGFGEFRTYIRRDPVLFASLVLALVSMVLVPPSEDYADYIDVRTLVILLCLMAVVACISSLGTFRLLARNLLVGNRSVRGTAAILVALPFFLSMFITNDVSLITFVPFAIIVLDMAGRRDLVIPVIVLQTLAANLGSMLLPFGNPQNIFIASKYDAGIGDFLVTVGPLVAIGAVILFLLLLRIDRRSAEVVLEGEFPRPDMRRLVIMLVLFVVCVLTVMRIVPLVYGAASVLVVVLLVSPRTYLRVDWGLLLTFVFLFIFAGNLASMDAVRDALDGMMSWHPVVSSAVVSQVISNVPAAVMLSNFTTDWGALLAGVNIGGFGTPIASMASIITLRIYSKEKDADRKAFLLTFSVLNILVLAVLLAAGCVM